MYFGCNSYYENKCFCGKSEHNENEDCLKTPYLPILGATSNQEMLDLICKAIVEEATAIDFYCRLLKEAPNELYCEFIKHAFEDEQEHLKAFTKLYCHLSDKKPHYDIYPIRYPCFKDGLLMALKAELEAAEFYRNVQLSTTDQLIKDTFYFAMVDELEHATQFSTLFCLSSAKHHGCCKD